MEDNFDTKPELTEKEKLIELMMNVLAILMLLGFALKVLFF